MMRDIVSDGGMTSMMWGMGIIGALLLAIGILAVAALVKYLFFR